MNARILMHRMVILVICCLVAPLVKAQADCSKELAIFDDRIAAAEEGQQKQTAQIMRDNLEKMCGHFDESMLQAMLESLEQLLPTTTREERIREGRARSAELKAERQARKAAEAAAPKPVESEVIRAAPTAKSVAAQFVNRSDNMFQLWIWDWDTYQGNLRVLYTTFPDITQFGLADWRFNVYVVRMTPGGEATQVLVTSKQSSDHAALALRRGHDEVLFQRREGRPGHPTFLERWSISQKKLLSSIEITEFQWSIDGETWRPMSFPLATSDGNLLFGATKPGTRKDRVRVGWFKVSPGGKLLGSGTPQDIQDDVRSSAFFHTNDGGGGLIANVQARTDKGLTSGESKSLDKTVFGEGLSPWIRAEKRLFLVGSDGKSAWESTAIERTFFFEPEPPASEQPSMDGMQAQLARQTQAADLATAKYRANRSTNYLNVGPHRVEMVKPMGDGYAVLTTVTANRKLQPPIHGPYLVRLNRSGITKEIYLEPLARQLEAKITAFVPAPDGGSFYLLATHPGTSHVVLLDEAGNPEAYGRTSHQDGTDVMGMMSNDSGVWVFGHGYPRGSLNSLWIERIEFP